MMGVPHGPFAGRRCTNPVLIAKGEKHVQRPDRAFPFRENITKMGRQRYRAVHGRGEERYAGGDATQLSARGSDMDAHIGRRILERRLTLGLTLHRFAQLIGVSYQQAGKYERGLNRVSAGRLHDIALVLKVPMSWFFERVPAAGSEPEISMRQPLLLELMRNFVAISNQSHQEALSEMARALAPPSRNDAGGER